MPFHKREVERSLQLTDVTQQQALHEARYAVPIHLCTCNISHHTDENTSRTEKIYFILSTVNEAVRVGNNRTSKESIPVYPYSRHTYDPAPGHFYTRVGVSSITIPHGTA